MNIGQPAPSTDSGRKQPDADQKQLWSQANRLQYTCLIPPELPASAASPIQTRKIEAIADHEREALTSPDTSGWLQGKNLSEERKQVVIADLKEMLPAPLAESDRHSQKITRLVNTGLWVKPGSSNKCQYTIDLTRIPLADLLVPQRNLPQQVNSYIEDAKSVKINAVTSKLEQVLPSPEKRTAEQNRFVEQLNHYANMMSDIRYIIPFFKELGEEIQHQLSSAGECTPPLHQNRAFYQLYIAAIPCPAKRTDRSPQHRITGPVLNQMDYKIPFIRGNKLTFPAPAKGISQVMTQALGALAMQDLQPNKAPTFIGYIPFTYANEWACDNGFLDSNASLIFTHGTFPHAIALTFLSRKAGLDRKGLRQIIKYNVWNTLLDLVGIVTTSVFSFIESPNHLFMAGFHRAIIMDNPTIIQDTLLLARVSEALETILEYPDIEEYLPEISRHMKEPITTREQLQSMVASIQELENYLTQFELNNRQEIISYFPEPVAENHLFYGKLGDFNRDTNALISIRKEAARLFEQADTLLTGYIWNPDKSWTPCAIQSLDDIEKCTSFVACEKSPDAPPPHARKLHYPATKAPETNSPEATASEVASPSKKPN